MWHSGHDVERKLLNLIGLAMPACYYLTILDVDSYLEDYY